MRHLLVLLLVSSLAPATECTFTEPTSGFSLKLPFAATQTIGDGVVSDALAMVTYGGRFEDETTSVVIMVMKRGNAGVDLDEYVTASKEAFKQDGGLQDLANVPAKLGRGMSILPAGERSGNLIYQNKVKDALVTITIQSTQATLPKFRAWIEANNR